MAEFDHLLGKADALMARHRQPGAPADTCAGIPVLDEVVQIQPDGEDLPLLTEVTPATLADDERVPAHEQKLRASLLAALQPQIDALIEERLKQDLLPLVEAMVQALRDPLQRMAHDLLVDIIRAAVAQELNRRK